MTANLRMVMIGMTATTATILHNFIMFSILCHMINVTLTIRLSALFSLITISEPIMKIVTELFQDVHMITDLAYSALLIFAAI